MRTGNIVSNNSKLSFQNQIFITCTLIRTSISNPIVKDAARGKSTYLKKTDFTINY